MGSGELECGGWSGVLASTLSDFNARDLSLHPITDETALALNASEQNFV